ncbi:MAG: hypothetical protein WC734_05400 [Patescibacteria group bacterium]|jgi:hypothetical protein
MPEHIITPQITLAPGFILPIHAAYLKEWRENAIQQADHGLAAASVCLQASLIDLVLDGHIRHDWLGIMEELLTVNDVPVAYSEQYGNQLYHFGGQYLQPTIHAIHTRWWIERQLRPNGIDHVRYSALLLNKRQTDGLIYDKDVSATMLRHRMKSELTLSMALAVEVIRSAGQLTPTLAEDLATDIVAPAKCPRLGYISMEYFRLRALLVLEHAELFPPGIGTIIAACADALPIGWCDFAISGKIDAYMGTAKRTARDKPIHSPLVSAQVETLLLRETDDAIRAAGSDRLAAYRSHLRTLPMDIPAFQMRDIPLPFGSDKTPIEAINASYHVSQCQNA